MTAIRSSLLVSLLAVGTAVAQQPAVQPLTVKPVKPDVYVAQGGAGGNTGIVIGRNGVVLIDAKATPESAKQVLAEVAKLTPKLVTHVILTHGDPDHVNGLAGLPAGVTVLAHENARHDLDAALASGNGRASPLSGRLPARFIARTGETLTIEDVKFELRHWAPAHTSGDLVVCLPEQKVVFTGDLVAADQSDPLIHLDQKGSSEGWITSLKGMLGQNADQFVPGDGDLQNRADVQGRLAAAVEKRDKIVALVREGKPLDQIRAAVGDPPASSPAEPGGSRGRGQAATVPGGSRRAARPATFTAVVYQELTGRQ